MLKRENFEHGHGYYVKQDKPLKNQSIPELANSISGIPKDKLLKAIKFNVKLREEKAKQKLENRKHAQKQQEIRMKPVNVTIRLFTVSDLTRERLFKISAHWTLTDFKAIRDRFAKEEFIKTINPERQWNDSYRTRLLAWINSIIAQKEGR